MASGFRPKRVAAQIHRELAQRLRGAISETEWGYISITHVEVSRDLARATISYMPLGGEKSAMSSKRRWNKLRSNYVDRLGAH